MTDTRPPLELTAEDTPPEITFADGVPIARQPAIAAEAAPPAAAPAPAPAAVVPAAAPAIPTGEELRAMMREELERMPAPAAPLPIIPVAAEAPDYLRPDAPHSFVRDAFAARNRDPDAAARLVRFSRMVEAGLLHAGDPYPNAEVGLRVAEALEAADGTRAAPGAAIIPPRYRPDLYVQELFFPRPLVDGVTSAPISDATPFTVPRFLTGTGLTQDVAAEGTNPAGGTITTDLVTVTPKAVSGIYNASRELVDSSAGGVAIDMIAMAAIRESWSEQTEVRLAAELNGAGNGTDVSDGAAPTGAAIEQSIRKELVNLANLRKAPATGVFADGLAFGALVGDNTTDGRPILPYNAYGTFNVAGRTEMILGAAIIGTPLELAWALTTHVNLVRRSDVFNFESPVRQWRWEEKLGPAQIQFALFGYQAARVLRPVGVTRITYTGTPVVLDYNATRSIPVFSTDDDGKTTVTMTEVDANNEPVGGAGGAKRGRGDAKE